LNVLHFHLGDDEGWRVELPALPELTAVGSRRGYTTTDEVPFLKQIYSGNGSPDATDSPANGYYTAAEFIDMLRYADSLGVAVIPEFDSPGHSRAAIMAMEHRYRTTGDASLRLVEPGDTSSFTSAQAFHDNVMNPALEGPYKFWGIVLDGVKDLYAQAGVELPAVHIGGDEVARGAWNGSAAAQRLMQEKGMTDEKQLHAHFVERVAELAAERGLKIAGWQEIALGHSQDYNDKVVPVMAGVNCWTNAGDKGSRIAAAGYPLILSNVDYLYFDQTPSTHPEEPGLVWGGLVDEFRPLHATVDRLCPGDEEVQKNVAGISAQLFAETVRDDAMVERYIFPRILGLAERAHSVRPTISDSAYFGAITAEMARWAAEGVNFNLRQPGIIRVAPEGKVEMNDAYGAGEIRYTLDGSDPTPESPLYTAPIDPAGAREVRARLFYGPVRSVVSILYL
ncbi:MAG: family 20 glycosylhydrolase, partial [Muribaculaceae bacterium]|nr:family 20 glycosylhydrolase [Muribaculaceae bacterium]